MTKIDWRRARKAKPTDYESDRGINVRVPFENDPKAPLARRDAQRHMGGTPIIAEAEIDAAKSAKGGFTRETLAKWGVPWPPPKGWRRALTHGLPVPLAAISPPPERAIVTEEKTDEAALMRQLMAAIVSAGRADILYGIPEVVAYLGIIIPTVAEVLGGVPEGAIITGGITFESKVYSFSCAEVVTDG